MGMRWGWEVGAGYWFLTSPVVADSTLLHAQPQGGSLCPPALWLVSCLSTQGGPGEERGAGGTACPVWAS